MEHQIPMLGTKETALLRGDYPSIEYLEAGNIASWLQERQDQLLIRAKDERNGMNLAKFITLATASTGAVCYATSPLAAVGAVVAGVGYLWSVVQDINDTHQFAPIPFIRGNFIEFLSAMGDSVARDEYFANKNELADLMLHLEPMEKYEFAMLKQSSHVVCEYLSFVEPGKRFYAYRWLLDWFIQLRGQFPTRDQLSGHLAQVTIDPRVNYQQVTVIQEAIKPQNLGIPPARFVELPSIRAGEARGEMLVNSPPASSTSPTPTAIVNTEISTYTKTPQVQYDLIGHIAKKVTNMLWVGVPGSGKGITISNAIDAIKRSHRDTHIFYIDPKGDEKETGYFKGRVDTLKRAKILEMSPIEAVKWVKDCFAEFQLITGDKLIILDEGTAVCSKFKNAKNEIGWLKDKIISYCSCGDSSGWHFWIVVQNPHTDDLGISGGLRSQLTSVALVHPDNVPAYNAMISTQLIPGDRKITSTQVMEIAAQSPVGRAVYYGGVNEWFPMQLLQNFSGYDRDNKKFLDTPKTNDSSQVADLDATETSQSQSQRVLALLERTTASSLDEFIYNELKLDGTQADLVRVGIEKLLKDSPLKYKFDG
ncbi:conserved hypothetical protein (plasmid) [Trichormus variabilis ATCC 29413]|uniref:Uncharacterized protein n=2 Tax=Anabaena variabilis TaxID=264691 RepID=Q3M229_TRIV2|nr:MULTISPECIES: hypothetical protein [Nostocaceae]ABA24957.1 conserved hypothetical protein [Trichormus variabilis ATCC 29413]MBC1217815.1 hypothetical protein [Trichormus variabilis ARAD]MBC1259297.1 hypothetical protein [Trichormus variabilis V5]MBC1305603.1 hypothetical protein [Trichormus variabilis N2B]MBC1314511.1 hypothetical protein [Trichormus variabilis PNB]